MTAVVTVRLAEPQFEGQTKEVLGTNAVRAIVAKVVEQELTARLTSAKRGDKAQAALLLEKVVSEMKSRISARLHKETQRRKNALESSTLPVEAARLPHDRRRALRAVHRRGRLGDGHRQGGAQLRVPGAAADPRQDPQRPEGVGLRHAQERRVRLDHPGDRCRLGTQLRPRRGPLRQGHHHDRRRRRRGPHPHAAADALLPLHASARRRRSRLRGHAAAAPASRSSTRARRRTS